MPPDDLPRSRTGRVPQWVRDEAAGNPTAAVPFRAYTLAAPPRTRRLRWRTVTRSVAGVAVLAALLAASTMLQASGWLPGGGAVVADRPPPGQGASDDPVGTPPSPPPHGEDGYRFLQTQDDDVTPVTWDPCRAIHYVVRPDHQPASGPRMVADAFTALSAATGYTFVFDGETDEPVDVDRDPYQPDRYGDRWAPVYVAWATPEEVPDFGVDIAGEAGPQTLYSPSGDKVYVTGGVYLDPAKLIQIRQTSGEPVARMVILHELGHLFGLAHIDDPNQVMFPRGGQRVTDYQPGDLTGLHRLASGPCHPDV